VPDKLFEIAKSENILVEFCDFPKNGLGFYSRTYKPPVILLSNKIKFNTTLLRVILAEELGHHFTGAVISSSCSNITSQEQLRNRIEQKALWWATCYLVPLEELIQLISTQKLLPCEIAKHFNVTKRFICTAITLYIQKRTSVIMPYLSCVDIAKYTVLWRNNY
jgi:Zn-dependent peptidase ImmA (M78 family)